MNVVVRFAPSPTGFIHIGGMRVALINWLFAKKHDGKFVLRIEDTDRSRYKPEFVESIDKAMKWLGLDPDMRVVQSDCTDRYNNAANELIQNKKAYYCYCSQEELGDERNASIEQKRTYTYSGKCRGNHTPDNSRPHVIRIDSSGWYEMNFDDMFYGNLHATPENLNDAIIIRSNGIPTFIFAAAVDDAALGVTHVIRGNDHITNTFQQILMLKLMGKDIPKFGHVPLLMNIEGQKLSKRHGAADLISYKAAGFYPEAIKNYLVYLGGLLGTTEMAFNNKELLENFDITRLNLSPSRFDIDKLRYINSEHIKKDPNLAQNFAYYMESKGVTIDSTSMNRINLGVEGLRLRSETLLDMENNAHFYLHNDVHMSQDALSAVESMRDALENLCTLLKTEWDPQAVIDNYMKQHGLKKPQIFGALRAALTGEIHAPAIYEILWALGQKESLRRLGLAVGNSPLNIAMP